MRQNGEFIQAVNSLSEALTYPARIQPRPAIGHQREKVKEDGRFLQGKVPQ